LLLQGVGEMFWRRCRIAGPLIAVLFLTDVRSACSNGWRPALNAFQLAFRQDLLLMVSPAWRSRPARVVETRGRPGGLAVLQSLVVDRP